MIKKIIIPTIFLVGMTIFFYPIIGNWISEKEHHTVLKAQQQTLTQMTDKQKSSEKEIAEKYNQTLNENNIPISDPFSEDLTKPENKGYYNVLDIGETMGSVEIPKINVDLPIYHGVSDEVLHEGVGHMSNSSIPVGGPGTHTALTAHRGLPTSKLFRNLDELKKGDKFYIHTLGDTLAYQVDDIQVVLPEETKWLEMDETHDYATLITCEPYMINTHRLLVRGERVPYEDTNALAVGNNEPSQSTSETPNNHFFIWIIVGAIALILIAVIWIRRKGSKGSER